MKIRFQMSLESMSVNLQNKITLASVARNQIPSNIKDYECELIIEEDIEACKSKKYLQFRHKDHEEPPFKIILNRINRPSSLMHVYKLDNDRFLLKGKVQRIAEARVDKLVKPIQIRQAQIDEDDEYVEKKLIFDKESSDNDSSDEDGGSESSSQGMAPTEESKSRIKTAIIEILNKRGKISSVKDLNQELKKTYKIKIPQSSAKEIALKVCNSDKKVKGFVLKPEYMDNEERMEGKKKVKYDSF